MKQELSTGCELSTASLKKREGEKRHSPLNPYREKGKGKEQSRVSLETHSKPARAYASTHAKRRLPCTCTYDEAGAAADEIVGNCFGAYETERIGVWRVSQWLARLYYGPNDCGSDGDSTASASWDAGVSAANSGNLDAITRALVTNIWSEADDKERKLWPNPSAADNHTTPFPDIDWNYNFVSPGFTTKRN